MPLGGAASWWGTTPHIGSYAHLWQDGFYDVLSFLLVFPSIIFLAASGAVRLAPDQRMCRFLGDISYPIHITHYSLIYNLRGLGRDAQGALSRRLARVDTSPSCCRSCCLSLLEIVRRAGAGLVEEEGVGG